MRGMKLAGGCLIALAIFVGLSIAVEFSLALAMGHGPFDWREFLKFFWPCPIAVAIGIWMWRRKPKDWLW